MKDDQLRSLADDLARRLTDKGEIVCAGFAGYNLLVLPKDAPDIQRREAKMAFFAGAQHLYASIMAVMDEDREPTDRDLHRLMLIDKELREFADTFQLQFAQTEGGVQ